MNKIYCNHTAAESCLHGDECAQCLRESTAGSLKGLRYALCMVKGRRILNRPQAYLAAIDEMEIFLEAAIGRVKHGESMHAVNVVQEACPKVDYSRCAGEPE